MRVALHASRAFYAIAKAYPKRVQCNACGWSGARFQSDEWHKNINCPRCLSGVRHRLLLAALEHVPEVSPDRIIAKKRVLHFAPEPIFSRRFSPTAAVYATADLSRAGCTYRIDMSNMTAIDAGAFDTVIACDVLEHVPDYRRALSEIHRVLSPDGWAILTVPQKDNLAVTYEDPSITEPAERLKHFGQVDHLRIFGHDFPGIVESHGFQVTEIDERSFPYDITRRFVLFPPELSRHPLATNYRRVFFCHKLNHG